MNLDKLLTQLIKAQNNMMCADDEESLTFEHSIALQSVTSIKFREEVLINALKQISLSTENGGKIARDVLKEIGELE